LKLFITVISSGSPLLVILKSVRSRHFCNFALPKRYSLCHDCEQIRAPLPGIVDVWLCKGFHMNAWKPQ